MKEPLDQKAVNTIQVTNQGEADNQKRREKNKRKGKSQKLRRYRPTKFKTQQEEHTRNLTRYKLYNYKLKPVPQELN